MFNIIFIHKHEGYVMFGRSGMVRNVDFRDIWELEPLPQFRFCNAFVTSKNQKHFVLVEFAQREVCQTYNILTVFHTF